jgi:hypothetical protein
LPGSGTTAPAWPASGWRFRPCGFEGAAARRCQVDAGQQRLAQRRSAPRAGAVQVDEVVAVDDGQAGFAPLR